MSCYSFAQRVETWNGILTVYVKPSDSDISPKLAGWFMNESAWIDSDGSVLRLATDGRAFKFGQIRLQDVHPETLTNYLADFGV